MDVDKVQQRASTPREYGRIEMEPGEEAARQRITARKLHST